MGDVQPTVDELVAALKNSALPTILVEGDEDVIIYRWIEGKIGVRTASLLPCGGRSNLLSVYDRRSEFSHLRTAFVADKDTWLFTAIPATLAGIIWTTGYSIENDVYAGSRIEELLDATERTPHRELLRNVIRWFAYEVEVFRSGEEAEPGHHLAEIVPYGGLAVDPAFLVRRNFQEPAATTIGEIGSDYKLKVRGKLLFEVLLRFLSAPARPAKYSRYSLYETSVKLSDANPHLRRLVVDVSTALKIPVENLL